MVERATFLDVCQLLMLAKFVQDAAGVDNAAINNLVVSLLAGATHGHEFCVAQEGEVLRNISFWKLQDREQLFKCKLPQPEQVQNLQSFRIGEDLINLGIFNESFFW